MLAPKTDYIVARWREGYTVDDIFSMAPAGFFKSITHIHVILSQQRAKGNIDAAEPRRRETFSPFYFGRKLWGILAVEARGRHMTVFELCMTILNILAEEPVIMRNLLDESEEKEASE